KRVTVRPSSEKEARAAVDAVARRLALPAPAFDFSIGWSDDYEALFARTPNRTTGISELLDVALQHGRVLLHAEGGTGKSVILRRLFLLAKERELVPVLVDLRRWRPPLFAQWQEWEGNDVLRMSL